jgi:hypothetical protein
MNKQPKSSLQERVARYKAIGDDMTNADEWLGALDDVVEGHNPTAIRLLLQLRPYDPADSFLDDMWNVIHAVEGYPDDVYVTELLKTAAEMSPYLLETLLIRLMNSSQYVPIVIQKLGVLSRTAKPIVRELIEKIGRTQQQHDAKDAVANCETVLAAMKGELTEAHVLEIHERGLKGPEALNAQALFVYALTELQTMAEMQGWDHFFTSDRMRFYPQLEAGLVTCGDRESLKVLEDYEKHLAKHGVAFEPQAISQFIQTQNEEYFRSCSDWRADFMRLADVRWKKIKFCLPAYLGVIGTEDEG